MIKLYGFALTRWVRPYWTLQELGIPFEPIQINLAKGEQLTPEFLSINPFAKLPALVDGDFKIFESTAICTYLADKYPEKGLIPRVGTHERALCDQWISFAITELEQPLWRVARHKFAYPPEKRIPAEMDVARDDFRQTAKIFEQQITSDYLVGNSFSVADIIITYALKWATLERTMGENLVAPFPKLQVYMDKLTSRPAFPRELYEKR